MGYPGEKKVVSWATPFDDLVNGVPRLTTPADTRIVGYPVGGVCVYSYIDNEIYFGRENETRIEIETMHQIQFGF